MSDDDGNETSVGLVSLKTQDMDGAPFTGPGQGVLLLEAIRAANKGKSQEEITDLLRARYPGLPGDNWYGNPAAEAVMRVIRRQVHTQEGQKADLARVLAKGFPASLARGGDPDAPEPRPDFTELDRDDWEGPSNDEVRACHRVGDLVTLCEQYGIVLSVDTDGSLRCQPGMAADSDLRAALHKSTIGILALLK